MLCPETARIAVLPLTPPSLQPGGSFFWKPNSTLQPDTSFRLAFATHDWSLPCLQAVDQANVCGVLVTHSFAVTLATSWDLVAAGVERVLMEWGACCLHILPKRMAALASFAFPETWYMARILFMPAAYARRLCRVECNFCLSVISAMTRYC
jgi:hypothetical protein